MCAAAVCKEGRREGEGMGYDAMAHDASSPSAARDAKKKRVRVGGSLRFEFGCFRLDEMGVLIRGDFFFWVVVVVVGVSVFAGESVGEAEAEQARRAAGAVAFAGSDLSRSLSVFFFFVFPIMFDFGCCWVGPGDLGVWGGGGIGILGFNLPSNSVHCIGGVCLKRAILFLL